jgi:hypothetical protein
VSGGGVTGGGVLPEGGGADASLPPQPESANMTTQEDATNKARMDDSLGEKFS